MILRRITQHIKNENWFAVTLDFIIVVIGVAVAMMGQEWLSERSQRANAIQAEKAIQIDLLNNYYYAKERIAIAECRKQIYQSISEKLLEQGDEWIGMPRYDDIAVGSYALPNLLRSPSRPWGSRNWVAELARGTFNSMDVNRRDQMDGIFNQSQRSSELQTDIRKLEGRMKTLALSTRISQSDRLRYLDMLGELDNKSALVELIASQVVTGIESIGLELTDEEAKQYIDFVTDLNERKKTIYGDCHVPITIPAVTEAIQAESQP